MTRYKLSEKPAPDGREVPFERLSIRLSADVLAALDAYAEKMRPMMPGIEITRSETARAMMIRGLEVEGLWKGATR